MTMHTCMNTIFPTCTIAATRLIQIAAVRSAINNIGKVILQDHIQHCIVDAVEHDDEQALDALCQAIDKFVK